MTIELTSYTLKDGILELYGIDIEESQRRAIEQERYDDMEETRFVFDTTDKKVFQYIRSVLWRSILQKKLTVPKTYGEAIKSLLGSYIILQRKYISYEG